MPYGDWAMNKIATTPSIDVADAFDIVLHQILVHQKQYSMHITGRLNSFLDNGSTAIWTDD